VIGFPTAVEVLEELEGSAGNRAPLLAGFTKGRN